LKESGAFLASIQRPAAPLGTLPIRGSLPRRRSQAGSAASSNPPHPILGTFFVLGIWEEISIDEIAVVLSQSHAAVKARV
jgi:hypothetical protein